MKINDVKPVVLYNADKQEIIGIFQTQNLVSKLLYRGKKKIGDSRVNYAVGRKNILKQNLFDFRVVVRYATEDLIKQLGAKDCLFLNGYNQPIFFNPRGYDSTREALYKKVNG